MLTNYGVATGLDSSADADNTLIAGQTLTTTNFQLYHGNAVAGTLALGSGSTILNGTSSAGSALDFAAEQARLTGISSQLATQASNSTANFQYGGYTLAGSQATGLNIFDISGANLSSTNSFNLSATAASFVLINVDGTANSFQNAGFSLWGGITAEHILLNFSDATSLSFGGVGIYGTVLAPTANVSFSNGQLNGSLIALSMLGSGEFHNHNYAGTLLDSPPSGVPEPASWAMLIGGFGLTGGMLRSKRSARALA
jgi:choice-of-anchor A domain-containing protein